MRWCNLPVCWRPETTGIPCWLIKCPHTGLLLTDEATLNLIHNSSGDLAHDYVSRIALWDRSQMTEGYRLAAEWVADKAREFGLEEVQIESYPSGGSTRYFGNTTERMKKLKSISFM